MRTILQLTAVSVTTSVLFANLCSSAATFPESKQTAPTLVGDYGNKASLLIEGNETFSKDQILNGIKFHLDYHLAAHPSAPLKEYTTKLEQKIVIGYQRAGFPSVRVSASADTNAQRVIARVHEGPRYRCGEILLSGVSTMTNELVRQKVADVINGWETAHGSQSNLSSLVWLPDHPAPFDDVSRQTLTNLVQQALAAMNYYRPKTSLRIVPDPRRKLADLKIEIHDEGIKGTLAEIDVGGLRANTRPQLLDYLKLTPGAEIHTGLVAATSNQLWRSGRFFRHDVSLTPLAQAGRFKLTIDLDEASDAPPLSQEFGDKEKALLKFRDWLTGWESRAEDFVISINLTNSSLQGRGELVLSPSGLALAIRDPDSAGTGQLQYAVVASENVMGLYSVLRKNKFVVPRIRQKGHVVLQVRPPSPKSYGQGNISFMVKLGVLNDQPFRLEMELTPAVVAGMASWMASTLKDGVLTLTTAEDSFSQKMRIDATTGRLLVAAVVLDQTNGCVLELRSEEGALARLFKEIAATTAEHPNLYTAKRSLASLVLFVGREVSAPQLTERILNWLDDGSAPKESNEASRQIHRTLVLIREFLAQPNLDAALEPLNQIFASTPDESAADEFVVPAEESTAIAHANPLAVICAWVLHASDSWFPRGSWPWVLLRESAFTVAGQPKYTEGQLDTLLKSDAVGPVGYLATAYLLGRVNPKLARTFAEQGLTKLNLGGFRQDYRLLSRTNSISGDLAANALGLLGGIGEAQLEPLVAGLTPNETAFIHQSTRLLREATGQPKAEAVWPAIERCWDTITRPTLERGLNQFLPQSQFLTNSQALYNRGVKLVSADSAFQDFEEAAQCFRKAATQGHAGAQLRLGILCQDGQGVPQDFGEAMRWFRKAAEHKESHATCRIAQLYQYGKGVPQDLDEAARWFRIDAEEHCEGAQFNLGLILEAKLDPDTAVKWYRLAAESGAIQAQAKLGNLLSDGFSVTPDYVEACQWLNLAAAAGDKASELRLRRLRANLSIEQLRDVEKRVVAAKLHIEEILNQQKKERATPERE